MRKSKYRLLLVNFPGYYNFFTEESTFLVNSQSVTDTTLTSLNGTLKFDPSKYDLTKIEKFEAQVEWESAGAGDIDVYDATNGTKIADVATPSAATSYTVTTVDITSYLVGLTSPIDIVIQAAGDGTNAVTVHKASLKAYFKL